jgi:NAD(P)-dependent dehydrogenase (short-subunit alcohol dehydrogenase family)
MAHAPAQESRLALASHSLSVFVAAYNEFENLTPTVEVVLKALSISVEDFEVIIVNDGSTDGTNRVADELAVKYTQVRALHNSKNMGLGYSYIRGVEESLKGSFVFIPGDNTWPYRSLVELFGNLGKADVITSYTTNPEIRPLGRQIVSSVYTWALNAVFGLHMRYFHGLTIYPLSFLRAHPITTYGFASMAEALLRAVNEGLSFIEVAVPIEERATGSSKALSVKNLVSVLSTLAHLFWELRLSPRRGPRARLALRNGGTIGSTRPGSIASRRPGVTPISTSDGSAGPVHAHPLRIVVTGGSSGIGAELVTRLAGDGHQVFVCARRRDRLDEVTQSNTIALGRVCDVSDENQVKEFAAWVGAQTPYVDVLLNCAGGFGAIGPLESTDSQEWFETFRVNLFGTYLVVKHFLQLLAGSVDPRIVNFSGGGAFSPFPNYSAYACSKAAVVRLTECLAAELAPRGIAVNAVAPGFVATDAHHATLRAGAEKAGALHYRRTKAILEDGGAQIANVVECVRNLLCSETHGLTGKTISANFDPWRTDAFNEWIPEISRSDLWTMRRVNIVNMPDGSLKTMLGEAWANHGIRK